MSFGARSGPPQKADPTKTRTNRLQADAAKKKAACATGYRAAPTTGAAAKRFNDSV